MINLDSLDNFYNSLKDIKVVNSKLDSQRELLKNTIFDFNMEIQKISFDETIKKQNKHLGEVLEQTINKLKKSSQKWVENFVSLLEQEKFRSDLENYFIVIVFGKVKAGKSSLGNFISRNHTVDEKAKIFKYDEAGKEQDIKKLEEIDENSEFAVNNLECTVEIQGFKLGGFAWIDTPGLGSMVKENGDLAKQYIKSADYIIYPTSSNAPLQQDEIAQLKELFEQDKQVTICITKSDKKIRMKDEKGSYLRDETGKISKFLTNKSDSDRSEQEDYVNTEIKNILNNDESVLGNIFSISSHTGQKGLDDKNEVLFDNSNMPKFYELMTDVVKNKSAQMKASTPYKGLISFIDNNVIGLDNDTADTIKSLQNAINYFDTQIVQSLDKFNIVKSNINNDITSEIEYIITKHQSSIKKGNESKIFKKIDDEISKAISILISKNIDEILNGFTTSLQELNAHISNSDEFSIQDQYETISVSYVNNGLTNLWGIFGDRYDSVDERVLMGDNKEETIRNFKQNRIDGLSKVADENYNVVMDNFFTPLKNSSQEVSNKIKFLIAKIENQKQNLQKGL